MIEVRHIHNQTALDAQISKLRNIVLVSRGQIVKQFTTAQARNCFVTEPALDN